MFDLNPNHYSLIVRGYHDPLKAYLKKHKDEIAEKKTEKSIEKTLTNGETVTYTEQKKEPVLPEKTEKRKESLLVDNDSKPQKKSKGPSKQEMHYQISEEENEQEKKNGKNGFSEKINGKKNENRMEMEISEEEENNENLQEKTRKRGRQPKNGNSFYKDNHPLEVDDSDQEETLLCLFFDYIFFFILLLNFFFF